VERAYTGLTGGGGANDFVLGTNVPNARITLAGFSTYFANLPASTTNYAANMGNMITFGKSRGTNAGEPINAVFTPADAFTIDTKVDDGRPGTGKWIANLTGGGVFGNAASCSTDASGADYAGTYRTNITDVACSFFIMTGY
jgi:hypothetical protein